MDPGDNDEPSREELESRVEQLEQTVSKMLPDRRGVIKGLGAAALGGAAVGASTGGASGQSAAGQVGTESEPVDVEGAQGNFDSVSTNQETNISGTLNKVELDSITKSWYPTSTDEFGTFEGNGGSFDVDAVRANLEIAAQADSYVLVNTDVFKSWNFPTWNKEREIWISFFTTPAQRTYVGTGRVTVEVLGNSTDAQIGAKIDQGVLYAYCADGNTFEEAQMRTGLSTTTDEQFRAKVYYTGAGADNPQATVTVSKFPTDGSTTPIWTAEHTFDQNAPLPSGQTPANEDRKMVSASGQTVDASSFEVHLNAAEFYLGPDSA